MIGNLPLPDISLVIIIKLKIGRNIIYVHEFISKLEFLIHEIFVEVEEHAFKQIIVISMWPNCALSLPVLFYFCEGESIENLIKDIRITKAKSSSLACRYIDDALIIQALLTGFHKYTESQRIWDKINNRNSILCLNLWHLSLMWHQWSGFTWLYNKTDDFRILTVICQPHPRMECILLHKLYSRLPIAFNTIYRLLITKLLSQWYFFKESLQLIIEKCFLKILTPYVKYSVIIVHTDERWYWFVCLCEGI